MKIQISQEEKEVYKENSDFFNRKRRRCIKIIKTQPLLRKHAPHCLPFRGAVSKKKNDVGHVSQFLGGRGGSRERKGFMVNVWWAGQEQQEDELVEELPDYYN